MEFIIGATFGLLVYIAIWCYGVEKAILRALEKIENKMGDVNDVQREIKAINDSINKQTEILGKIEENTSDTVKLAEDMTVSLDAIERK